MSSGLAVLAVLAAATSRPPGGSGTVDLPSTCAPLPLGSIANTLDHLRGIGPIADVVAEGNSDDWLNYRGPLLDA